MPTKTLIKIDRSTIRRNPDAGRTEWTVAGPSRATVRTAGITYESAGELTLHDHAIEGDFIVTESLNGAAIPGTTEHKQFTHGSAGVTIRIQRDVETIRTARPAPTWLYQYEPTPVTCRNCGQTFPASELEQDSFFNGEDDIPVYNICPRCQAPECCEVEYEKIEDAVRGR